MKWRKRRRLASGPDRDSSGSESAGAGTAQGPMVTATDTGDATARDGGTAVSGSRGPAPETSGSVHVSGTGPATANGGIANSGYLQIVVQSPGREKDRIDHPRPVEEWTAQLLGVHLAIHGTATPDADSAFVLPKYLERDHDRKLRDHLVRSARSEQATIVLVRGGSCTGKTRTAFEAVRASLSDWQLVFPKNAKRLLALLDADALAPRTVLWLNEAQNFLTRTDGEEAAAALHSRLEQPGPVVILGTLWPEYHRDLTATPQPGQHTKDTHPSARALLDQAVLIDVPASFTTEVLKDQRVGRDPSLAAATRTSTDGRITQTLAAGPQLVDHYEHPTKPHGPYGQAIVTAAMDARRLGHTSPLPAALLQAAAPAYLTEQQRSAADPDTWFNGALDYAREKVRGVAAALELVANPEDMGALSDVYHLSDYLDHHARTARRGVVPPESFWTAVRDHAANMADLNAVALAARGWKRYRIAASLYWRAVDAGDTEAMRHLVWLRERVGDWEGAERLARQAEGAGDTWVLRKLWYERGEYMEDGGKPAEGPERFGLEADGSPAQPWEHTQTNVRDTRRST
ncbi:hypothetical protein [Streptomyces decoyicus]